LIEYILKNPHDRRDYVIKLDRWLGAKERIAFASASVRPSSIKIERVKFTDTAVVLRLFGGQPRARHTVRLTITTTVGQVKNVEFGIYTQGDAAKAVLAPFVIGQGSLAIIGAGADQDFAPDVSVSGSMVVFTSDYSDEPDPGEDPEPSTDPFPLVTQGRRILRPSGEAVRIKALNWFGAEGSNRVPAGLWAVGYKELIDKIVGWGFNTIRIPFAGNTFDGSDASGVNFSPNPDLQSTTPGKPKKPIDVMDILINYAVSKGLMIILDHHRRTIGDGADGSPISSTYTKAQWIATWTMLANRYKGIPNVIGADLHNEPHNHDWPTWAGLAEECANALHQVAPGWLVFVEGVGTYNGRNYWWGGQLGGVLTRPVRIGKQNKLVYSAHDYGQSVGTQPWLATAAQPVAGYPNNLPAVFQAAWGFILEQNIAPVWVGEFGGHFGIDSGGTAKPNAELEKQWAIQLMNYLNSNEGHFGYWCLNPNSGDTGGLLRNDWKTAQTHKLQLLLPVLANTQ